MTMYSILQNAHAGWAYLVLLLVLVAVINALANLSKAFSPKDRKIALFALIASHLQLVFGLILYFVSPRGMAALNQLSDKAMRLTALEHPLINILALVLITMGWSKHKKATDSAAKFKSISMYYGLGLVLILSRIPWSLWF